ncbi:Transducin family protein / WD-40 repeat family protein [Quillaja saponaria]|uniref:Transducin family protein / WD-40 repeat family protein n=1 Tax=Quillaja saponaria TaxID=32244 RepID=A0AAD7PI04_QUISA|nr:Transducin family protein / WD-40 repeat family protein [Quillaja saponaria]
MKMRGSLWVDDTNVPSTSGPQAGTPQAVPSNTNDTHSLPSSSNVLLLLARRELAPRTKQASKRLREGVSKLPHDSFGLRSELVQDARRGLVSWVEAESLRHLSAKYCPLLPPPRSTIAAAFSHDGKTLASTHGDHTVKIIDCQTGNCLKVLSGHRRTPWVVRFHPLHPEILASGSLDHEVRLWDANTADCIGSRDFYRPIASIAFHALGELLAVASGHKLYMWHYNRRGEASSPTIVLKTRRSLRAVHFHPNAAPFLLTAEVNDLDSSDSSMTLATSPGYLRYPPPTVYVADPHSSGRSSLADELPLISVPLLLWPSVSRDDGRIFLQHINGDFGSASSNSEQTSQEETGNNSVMSEMDNLVPQSAMVTSESMDVQPEGRSNHVFPFGDPTYWELPFLQGWLIGQSQAGQRTTGPVNSSGHENLPAFGEMDNYTSSSVTGAGIGQPRVSGRSSSHHRSSRSRPVPTTISGEGATLSNIPHNETDPQLLVSRIQSELAAAAAAELPCTVKLRIWHHDVKDPCAPLDPARCRLTIPHAVLCSEMGAHFSPCGRYLAACVACMLPHLEPDPGLQLQHDILGASTSPTRHPVSAHHVLYELRIYSLEEATFGSVLASRAIRAAHCLTSIQFSPTSEHLLLAYGRRHNSLLKSIVIDGETTIPVYTILEVYRVSDMELVRVLPSAEDEVNVACFHPSVGGGLVYGTKEGKLRILQNENSRGMNGSGITFSRGEHA